VFDDTKKATLLNEYLSSGNGSSFGLLMGMGMGIVLMGMGTAY